MEQSINAARPLVGFIAALDSQSKACILFAARWLGRESAQRQQYRAQIIKLSAGEDLHYALPLDRVVWSVQQHTGIVQ